MDRNDPAFMNECRRIVDKLAVMPFVSIDKAYNGRNTRYATGYGIKCLQVLIDKCGDVKKILWGITRNGQFRKDDEIGIPAPGMVNV